MKNAKHDARKINLLLPIAGRGQRFVDQGYPMPKPLVMVDDKPIIEWSLDSIVHEDCNLIFVVREDHVVNFSLDRILRDKFGADIEIITATEVTHGTVCSCLLARDVIDSDTPLTIFTPDVYFQDPFDPYTVAPDVDGLVLTFRANSPAYSYAEVDADGWIRRTAEKTVISPHAAVGVYHFQRGRDFVQAADEMIRQDLRTNDEFYVCPLYNLLIQSGLTIASQAVEKMHVLGTPEELSFFVKNSLIRFGTKPIALCADHSGYDLKETAKDLLSEVGIRFIDFGTYTDRDCDYFDYLSQVARALDGGQADFALCFCRTGQGMNIAANKLPGVRAALTFDEYTAEYAVRHNCANVFSVPSKYVDEALLRRMIAALQNSSFDGGRHQVRVEKLASLERQPVRQP